MSVVQEFKQFAMKGNVIDLAVGIIIGAAFGKIVSVLVEKVLMPPIGLLVGGVDFSQLRIILKGAGADGKGEVAIGYGEFLQAGVNFFIIAVAVFGLIKAIRLLKHNEPAPVLPPTEEVLLLRDIRKLLAEK